MALSRNLWQHFNPNRAPSHLQTSVMVWDKHKLMIDLHVHIAVSSIPRTPGLPVGEALRFAALNGYRAVGLILRSSELDMPPLMPLAKDIFPLRFSLKPWTMRAKPERVWYSHTEKPFWKMWRKEQILPPSWQE